MVEIRRFVEANCLILQEQNKNGMGGGGHLSHKKTKPNASLIHIRLYIAST